MSYENNQKKGNLSFIIALCIAIPLCAVIIYAIVASSGKTETIENEVQVETLK